ncbi:MAG: hypothetical protein LBJ02_02345 [Bifidobacteriaceae bacterium]|nr:hypothetical protein [Bifidobacteriaceae bacterium]
MNIAGIELSCVAKHCLGRRVADLETLNRELASWRESVNVDKRQGEGQFTTRDARAKLRHLNPKQSNTTVY